MSVHWVLMVVNTVVLILTDHTCVIVTLDMYWMITTRVALVSNTRVLFNFCYCLYSCVDSNECKIGNGGCSHTCTNQVGSYECSCYDGYKLAPNNHGCIGRIHHNVYNIILLYNRHQ